MWRDFPKIVHLANCIIALSTIAFYSIVPGEEEMTFHDWKVPEKKMNMQVSATSGLLLSVHA